MMELKNGNEVVGTISGVEEKDGYATVVFTTTQKYEIPAPKVKKLKLQLLLGKRIGLIHLDGGYKMRRILE